MMRIPRFFKKIHSEIRIALTAFVVLLLFLAVSALFSAPKQAEDLLPTQGQSEENPSLPADTPIELPEDQSLEPGTEPSEEASENGTTEPPEAPPEKIIALTLDDGPNPKTTPDMIAGLAERGVPATFFVLGKLAEEHPEIVLAAYEAGNQIATHGWAHQNNYTKVGEDIIRDEIDRSSQVILDITGEAPLYLRPPYGSINKQTAARIDMPMMLWTIDPRDWDTNDPEKIRAAIVDAAYDGGVIIAHDIFDTSVQGVLMAVDDLLAQGYRFVTLEEYYRHYGITPQPHCVYRGQDCVIQGVPV